jgi:DNA-binding transcriptional ArsR family regulator
MSFCEEIRRAVMASPRMKLPEIRSAMYRAFSSGQITEAEAETLDALINTKAAIPATEAPARRRVGSRPRSSASMERRRSWAAAGRLPPALAARFTLAEQAVLAVVAVEVSKRGRCGLTVAHLAALAGVSESTVRNALREAEALGLVSIDRRRRSPWINYPNDVQILSKEWASWLRLRTGANSHSPRTELKNLSGLALTRENMNPRPLSAGTDLFRKQQSPAEPEEGLSAKPGRLGHVRS